MVPLLVPVTVIVCGPVGVELVVDIVRVREQLGLQLLLVENVHKAPVGRPEQEKATDCVVPDVRVVTTFVFTLLPLGVDPDGLDRVIV